MTEKETKKLQNSQEDYDEALASEDPTEVSKEELEDYAKEAMKKFKSLS